MASEYNGTELVLIRSFEDVNDYPLSNSLRFIICLLITYLLFVLKIGPEFMKNRKPYKLNNIILTYNAFQVVLSAVLVYISAQFMYDNGIFPKRCCEDNPEMRQLMFRVSVIYLVGKLTELLDTVFFILRKKYNQVTFLHVYHHTSVVIGTWATYKYSLSQTAVWTGFINSLVHVFMYFYYFMAALGPQYQKYLTWKKYITTFQLVQFVSIVIHQIISLAYTSCKHTVLGIAYMFLSSMIFYYLFSDFYSKSYTNPKKVAQNGMHNGTEVKAKPQ